MQIDSQFYFGKYKGLTIREVIQGTEKLNRELIKGYISEKITNNPSNAFVSSFLSEIMNFEISDTLLRLPPLKELFNVNWSKTIEDLLKNSNSWADRLIGNESLDDFNIKKFSVDRNKPELAGGNPEYIEWCIKNVNDFFIEIDQIEELQLLDVYRFIGIEVSHKIDDIYEYKPTIRIEKYLFSKETTEINQKKFNSYSVHIESDDHEFKNRNYDRDTFDAMTDGQLGDYDDFDGDIDDVMIWAGRD